MRLSPVELVVRCLKGPRRGEVLSSISGRLTNEVLPEQCWFALERVRSIDLWRYNHNII